ncbi:MAG: hypothetical protein SOW31_03125 [Treponema sp.]|nr:hypothetical protein [Treponema sp.]
MKLGKKLMVVAMAVATIGLVGCNMNEDEFYMIDFDAPAGTANINYTNLSDNQYTRGWRTFNSKHQDADCTIRFKKPSSNESNGNMGYIFNMKKNDDKSISFDVITVGYKKKDNKNFTQDGFYYYASRYENVGKDYINGNLNNFADINGKVKGEKDSVVKETALDGINSDKWTKLEIDVDGEGYYNVIIELEWNTETNKFKVDISEAQLKDKSWEKKGRPKKTIENIEVLDEGNNSDDPQYPLGAYAMAIKGQTVEGDWIFTNFTKEPIVLEEIEF